MKVRLLAEAEEELREAVLYYEDRQLGLGAEFHACVSETIKAVQETPNRFAIYEGKPLSRLFRRALVKRFPYVLVFEVRQDEVLVVTVAHGSREPGYWETRASGEPNR